MYILKARVPITRRSFRLATSLSSNQYRRTSHTSRHEDLSAHHWPVTKADGPPTPYQIFGMTPTASYDKASFYRLVKIYHPDRSVDCTSSATSNVVQLERYRLVVAAHEILSDPVKRNAYDRFGAGWAGRKGISDTADDYPTHSRQATPQHNDKWSADPFIWSNATWEDWERWRERNANPTPGPLYLQNSYFVSLVLLVALIGSTANYSRADGEGLRFVAARDAIHDRASKDLRRVRQDSGYKAKDERIDYFVRSREASLTRLEVLEEGLREERVRNLLPVQEPCRSGEMTRQDD